MAVLSLAELLSLLLQIYFFTILVQIILSWVSPGAHNPVVALLHGINEPLLGRARRMLPPIQGFDLSPILVMIFLQLLTILLVAPVMDMGRALSFG